MEETMMEEREEQVVAHGGGSSAIRKAHFLKPTIAQTQDMENLRSFTSKGKALKVVYQGWRGPQKSWEQWVHKLQPIYGDVWKKSGVFDAIISSTYKVVKNKDTKNLMMKLSEKWRPETNTFLFSWGECTVTLEDLRVLGGFSVLGETIIKPLRISHLEERLREVHSRIQNGKEIPWLSHFSEGGEDRDLEHEAFLALWLSRYVLPGSYSVVEKDLFSTAINLSRGIPVALAPTVLAAIYRDLGSLKKASLSNRVIGKLILSSPLELVQIWVWERFPELCPEPRHIELGMPKSARWCGVKPVHFRVADDVARVLDSSGGDFRWRPYAPFLENWNPKKFYMINRKEDYIVFDPDMYSEIEDLIRCWRSCELVGLDCLEPYLPHRVAMQFGFDQDIPGPVEGLNGHSAAFAWRHYNRPVTDSQLYVPARLFESRVTRRYREEWERANAMQGLKFSNDDVWKKSPVEYADANQTEESGPKMRGSTNSFVHLHMVDPKTEEL